MELLSKISMKGIGAQPPRGFVSKENPGPIPLAMLYGRTSRYTIGNSTFGEFTKFGGSFEAVNVATGAAYRSGNILLPRIVEDLLRGALDDREDQNAALEFSLEVGVKYADTATGYEYTVRPLVELAQSDELSHLRESAQKALPAPEKESGADSKSKKK